MKKKVELEKIIVVIFVLFLLLPNVLFWIVKDKVDTNNYENRVLAERPTFAASNWKDYFYVYDKYYSDNFPFRNQLVGLDNWINIYVLHDTYDENVVFGKDGWLFYRGDTTIEKYCGVEKFSEEELEAIRNNILQLNKYYEQQGIEFVVFIAPDKEEIYSEYMPDNISVIDEESKADQVYEMLRDSEDVSIIYPKTELLESKNVVEEFYKLDTHWNLAGGFIGAQSLMQSVCGNDVKLNEVSIILAGEYVGDLAKMAGLADFVQKDTVWYVDAPFRQVEVQQDFYEEHGNLSYQKYSSNAPNNMHLYMIGDSFASAMGESLRYQVSELTMIHRDDYHKGLVEEAMPDVVVYEVVERHIDSLLNDSMKIVQ